MLTDEDIGLAPTKGFSDSDIGLTPKGLSDADIGLASPVQSLNNTATPQPMSNMQALASGFNPLNLPGILANAPKAIFTLPGYVEQHTTGTHLFPRPEDQLPSSLIPQIPTDTELKAQGVQGPMSTADYDKFIAGHPSYESDMNRMKAQVDLLPDSDPLSFAIKSKFYTAMARKAPVESAITGPILGATAALQRPLAGLTAPENIVAAPVFAEGQIANVGRALLTSSMASQVPQQIQQRYQETANNPTAKTVTENTLGGLVDVLMPWLISKSVNDGSLPPSQLTANDFRSSQRMSDQMPYPQLKAPPTAVEQAALGEANRQQMVGQTPQQTTFIAGRQGLAQAQNVGQTYDLSQPEQRAARLITDAIAQQQTQRPLPKVFVSGPSGTIEQGQPEFGIQQPNLQAPEINPQRRLLEQEPRFVDSVDTSVESPEATSARARAEYLDRQSTPTSTKLYSGVDPTIAGDLLEKFKKQDYTPEDLARYIQLKPGTIPQSQAEMSSPEFQARWQEFEALRNKYGGMPPKQLEGGQNAISELRPNSLSQAQAPGDIQQVEGEIRPGASAEGAAQEGGQQNYKFPKEVEDEIRYKIEDVGHEEGEIPTRNQVIKELIQDSDLPDSVAYTLRKPLQDYGIKTGIYKPNTLEDIKNTTRLGGGKKYDFKRGDIYYTFDGWKHLSDESQQELIPQKDVVAASGFAKMRAAVEGNQRVMNKAAQQDMNDFGTRLYSGIPFKEAGKLVKDIIEKQWDEGHPDNGGDGYWILLKDGWTVDGSTGVHEATRKQALNRVKDAVFNTSTGDAGTKLYSGLPIPEVVDAAKKLFARLKADRSTLVSAVQNRDLHDLVGAKRDAVDSATLTTANKAENHINLIATRDFGDSAQAAKNAVFAILDVKGDQTKLAAMQSKVANNPEALAAVKFADKNWNALQPLVQHVGAVDAQNMSMAKAAGVSIPQLDDYLKRQYQQEERGFFFRDQTEPGIGQASKNARKYPTLADAIADGLKPQTLDAAALVGKRTAEIQREINQKTWIDTFKTIKDKAGNPIITDLKQVGKGVRLPDAGYVSMELTPGHSVGVLKGFKSVFDAVTGTSRISGSKTGQALLQSQGVLKHSMLAFDSFHAFRVAQFYKSLGAKNISDYKLGLSLLEYSKGDLAEAAKQGLIPQEAIKYANEPVNVPQGKFSRQEVTSLGIQNGLIVGRHSEALYTSFVRSFPIVKDTLGRANRFIFDKLSRGAALDAFQINFERVANDHPTWTKEQVARNVARDINFRLGNIGRQGIFKSRQMQDLTQLAFLAPRWVESMAQSEVRSAGQIGKSLIPGENFGKLGTLGKSTSGLLAAYVVATQILNILTTGKPTWNNDKDHQLDAYIPSLTKEGKGFYLSPLSVVAELTHDALRYTKQGKNPAEVAAQITMNKLSPISRAIGTGFTGTDWQGGKIDDSWNRVKQVAFTLATPAPLPLQASIRAVKQRDLSPLEHQVFAMAGFKVEPESTAEILTRQTKGLNLKQRIQFEEGRQATQPQRTPEEKLAGAEKAEENIVKRGSEMASQMSRSDRNWVESRGLSIPGYDNKLKFGDKSVTLTSDEMDKLSTHVQAAYVAAITKMRSDPRFNAADSEKQQIWFNNVMIGARKVARGELIREIQKSASTYPKPEASRSINEQNYKAPSQTFLSPSSLH